jgi:hypothetical protein
MERLIEDYLNKKQLDVPLLDGDLEETRPQEELMQIKLDLAIQ